MATLEITQDNVEEFNTGIEDAPALLPMLRVVKDVRQTVQKQRIRVSNQLSALERNADQSTEKDRKMLEAWLEVFEQIETRANKDLSKAVRSSGLRIYDRLIEQKGIGDIMAARLIVEIDIVRADTVSSLWKYAGYGVNAEGKRDRPVKGQKLGYNKELKIVLRLIVESFIKCKSPYASIYYTEKEKWMARPDMTKMHAHNAAIGKVAKVFLAHLWHVWRVVDGLPIRSVFAIEKMGHTHYITPEEYGWDVSQITQ